MKKRFIVEKYVMANSAREALEEEKKIEPDCVSLDVKWLEKNDTAQKPISGFKI